MSDRPEPSEGEAAASEGRLGRLFKNTTIYALGDVAVNITNALFAPIYTVLLAPAAYGSWTLAVMLLQGLWFLYNPALHGAITRYFFTHEHDEPARRRFQGTVSTFLLVWSLSLSILLWLFGPMLFEALFDDFPFYPYGSLVTWMALLRVLSVVPNATWAAAERAKAFVGVNLLSNTVNVFGALVLVAGFSSGVLGLFWARLASLAVVCIPYSSYLLRHVGFAWSWHDLGQALRFGLPLVPHLVAHWVLSMSDRFVLERYGSMEMVGIYGAAYVFTEAVNKIAVAVNRAWVPIFTRDYETPGQRPFIGRSITYFVISVAGLSAVLTIMSPLIVRTLYDERYAEAGMVVSILAVGGLFQGLYYIYAGGLFYYKRNAVIPFITVSAGLANLGLNILWIPRYGIAGAAFATLIGYALLTLGVRWGCRRVTLLPFETARLRRFSLVYVVVCGAGLAIDGLMPWWGDLTAKLAMLVGSLFVLDALGFWEPDEREWARGKLRRIRARLGLGGGRE